MNKGYVYALLAAVCLATTIVINSMVVDAVNSRMASFSFFFVVFVLSSVALSCRKISVVKNLKSHWKDGLIVGGFNATAATFFFLSLNYTSASTTAFLSRLSTIFIIIIGIIFLKEKLTAFDIPGMLLAVFGAFLINNASHDYTAVGLLMGIMAALGIALHQVSAKMFVKRIKPLNLVGIRTFYTSAILLIIATASQSLQKIPPGVVPLMLISGAIATVGFIALYKSFELADVSKVAIIRTIDPFIVLIYGVLFFEEYPTFTEVIGGSFIVAGVVLIILKHRINRFVRLLKLPGWMG